MAAEQEVYNVFRKDVFDAGLTGETNTLQNSTFKAILYSTGYVDVSNRIDQDFVLNAPSSSESVQAFEPSTGTGYERQSLASLSVTEDDTGNRADADADDVTFSSVSSSAGVIGGMVIAYEFAANDSSGVKLMSNYVLSSSDYVSPNGGDITFSFSTGGFLQATT